VTPRVAKLTPRKLMTDAHGRCSFSGVFVAGAPKERNRRFIAPGVRHTVSADWNTLKCAETIDQPPAGETVLFLQ